MKRVLVLDTEILPNYFLAMFKSVDSGKVQYFEMYEGHPLDRAKVLAVMQQFTIVSFNGESFDMVIMALALRGRDNAAIKAASDQIIAGEMKSWMSYEHFGVQPLPGVDHIDLKETVPGVMISLKLYGARMHSRRLQDMPIHHDTVITPEQRIEIRGYCENDLDTTIDLWLSARNPKDDIIATREKLTEEFGIDMRSKSDAQCAEAMIKVTVEKSLQRRVYKQEVAPGTSYQYQAPAFIQFSTPLLKQVLADVLAAKFVVQKTGQIELPALLDRKITINKSSYQMGIGGLHSSEQSQGLVATADTLIIDRDVVSYYPSLILLCGLFPKSMGVHFQKVYGEFFRRRIAAKKSGDKSVAQTLKIVLNGTFGKLGSKYSILYSPDLLIQVTVTGQLAILMLIERMEAVGIHVRSANTDGIVMMCPTRLEQTMFKIVAQWEKDTGLETEETRYRALYSRDVNNYLALKVGGGSKSKGTLVTSNLAKNPDYDIVAMAVVNFLDKGTPLAETVLKCRDIRHFLRAQRVTGGAQMPTLREMLDEWVCVEPGLWAMQHGSKTFKERRKSRPHPVMVTRDAEYLGKVVRWYRSTQSRQCIEYVKNGNKVSGSDNAKPLMTLPDTFPSDVDYGFYLAEATALLKEIGA